MNEKDMEDMVKGIKEMEDFIEKYDKPIKEMINEMNLLENDSRKKVMTFLIHELINGTRLTAESRVAMLENLKFISLLKTIGITNNIMADVLSRLEQGRLAEEDLGLK